MNGKLRFTTCSKKIRLPRSATTAGLIAFTFCFPANRLVFDVRREDELPVIAHYLSLTPFRKMVKDYFMMCESYYQAIRTSTPSQIEAIDMGRRGLHNEGSELLMERLKNKIDMDFDTARRLFTLITVLHWKG